MRRNVRMLVNALLAFALLARLPSTGVGAQNFPAVINLPNGWQPEGIATGRGPVIYAGSLANGAIYAADLRTGEGRVVVQGQQGRVTVGLSYDQRSNYLFAAGGGTGKAFVFDMAAGALVKEFTMASEGPTFVNDVIVTRDAAYFTDSMRPVIYRLPLGPTGRLSARSTVATIPLTGDYEHIQGFNANGIEATPNGKNLIIVHSNLGRLYRVNPANGQTSTINLNGASVTMGDGILLRGNILYVVRNRANEVVAIRLDPSLTSGTVASTLTSPNFDVPTTLASFGSQLYAVNARFGTPPVGTSYTIVQVPAGQSR